MSSSDPPAPPNRSTTSRVVGRNRRFRDRFPAGDERGAFAIRGRDGGSQATIDDIHDDSTAMQSHDDSRTQQQQQQPPPLLEEEPITLIAQVVDEEAEAQRERLLREQAAQLEQVRREREAERLQLQRQQLQLQRAHLREQERVLELETQLQQIRAAAGGGAMPIAAVQRVVQPARTESDEGTAAPTPPALIAGREQSAEEYEEQERPPPGPQESSDSDYEDGPFLDAQQDLEAQLQQQPVQALTDPLRVEVVDADDTDDDDDDDSSDGGAATGSVAVAGSVAATGSVAGGGASAVAGSAATPHGNDDQDSKDSSADSSTGTPILACCPETERGRVYGAGGILLALAVIVVAVIAVQMSSGSGGSSSSAREEPDVPTRAPTNPPTPVTVLVSDSPTNAMVGTSDPATTSTPRPTSSPFSSDPPRPTPTTMIATTDQPNLAPSGMPTRLPTAAPTSRPTARPTQAPSTTSPTELTARPTPTMDVVITTNRPTGNPSNIPTRRPTDTPTGQPTKRPTTAPTASPSAAPTKRPTAAPSAAPTDRPTAAPIVAPTKRPTAAPTAAPTKRPTAAPTAAPTKRPTTAAPTAAPTNRPTNRPTAAPKTRPPTRPPTSRPTPAPVKSPQLFRPGWIQLAQDLDGEAEGDGFGRSVALSADGSIVASGAIRNDGGGSSSGHVRVYEYRAATNGWKKLGDDIDGEAASDLFGHSIALSSDGTILAASAIGSGHVRVFQYNSARDQWSKLGADLDEEAAGDQNGWSVALSANGSIVACGATLNDGNGMNSGNVRVFEYSTATNQWRKLGADLEGSAERDRFGNSVALSAAGTVLAVGSDGYSGTRGVARVYQYTRATNRWNQMGADLVGEAERDEFGDSVSLSEDGAILAVGAVGNSGRKGHVRVFEYNTATRQWQKLGADVDGEFENDRFGSTVALSADGMYLAVGAHWNDGNGDFSGQVRLFQYIRAKNQWEMVGADLEGEAGDQFGNSVALSSNGAVLATGGYGRGGNRGSVSVFRSVAAN